MWLHRTTWGVIKFSVSLEGGVCTHQADAPLTCWDLFHASRDPASSRGALSRLLSLAILLRLFYTGASWPQLRSFTRNSKKPVFSPELQRHTHTLWGQGAWAAAVIYELIGYKVCVCVCVCGHVLKCVCMAPPRPPVVCVHGRMYGGPEVQNTKASNHKTQWFIMQYNGK